MSECDEADIWSLLLNTGPAKCHFQHLIPVWGEIRTFSFNLKGHAGIHPDNGARVRWRSQGNLTDGSFFRLSPCEEEKPVCRELTRTSWPSQGDPEKPGEAGPPSAPEQPFCKTRVLGTDPCIRAFVEQKCIYVSGSELGPVGRR